MKKRLLALCLTLCLLVGLLPTTALATGDTVWTDEVTEQPAGYTVESSGDVTISSAEGLAWLAQQVNEGISFSGKTITLSENIDLSAHEWVPIGTQAHPFDGTFDGGNYQISGMSITVSETNTIAGLFGYVGASTIQDVVIQRGQIAGMVTTNSDLVINLGGLAGANVDQTNVTIENCTIDTAITLTTTGSVETNIGGVIGYVDDYSNTYATIRDTDVVLSVNYTSADTNNTTNIGGIVGDMHSYKDTSFIENGDVELSVSITGSADGWSTLYHIGGVVGYMPTHGSSATSTVVSLQNMTVDTKLDFTSSSGILIDAIFSAPAEIGGFFGRGFRYRVTDCFAKTLLRGPDGETPSHYGNLAGYTYNDEISCERVYTYASRYEGNTLFENERLSRDNSNMPNYPLTDVYYIEPQELTEGVEGVPFLYKTFHDSHQVTAGINDGVVYRDGDSGDGITVTPGADGKTVAITPANERCAVGGHLDLSSGFELDFVLPVPVYPDGGGTYAITTEVNDLTNPGGWTSCKVTTEPVEKAKAGDQVTITAKPVPFRIKLVDSVTVTTEDGTPVNVTKTDGDVTGDQTYTFTMPASNVTITGVFRAISTEFTLSPSTVTFDVYEGYTAEDVEPQTVTITNTGDKDVTFEGSYALPTSTYYEIQPGEGNWGGTTGREITIAPGETATFTVAPKPGLTSATNPNTVKPLFYSTEKKRVYLTLQCNVTQAPVYTMTATPDALSFGQLYEGYTAPSGQTVRLTNTGTGTLNVTLPTFEHFTITPGASWNNGAVSLAPNDTATVTVTPKQGLTAGTYPGTLSFTTDQAGVKADVSVSVTVVSHDNITITPADITVYTGGEGYTGAVDNAGNESTTANGLPEPGYYITLPDELNAILGGDANAEDLSKILKFTYQDDADRTREWKLELYGTEAHSSDVEDAERQRYIYRMLPGVDENKQQIPVRLQFTDSDGKVTISDEFTPNMEEQYQKYTMRIYSGELDTSKITASLTLPNGQTVTCGVNGDDGNLVVRGLTGEDNTTEIISDTDELSGDGITALATNDVTYYINGSNVELTDTEGVRLLVDDVLNDSVLVEYIQNNMTEKVPAGDYAYEQQYLDLVDTKNGNAYLTMGEKDSLTIYWKVPDGFDSNKPFYVVHFDALNRNYDKLETELSQNTPDLLAAKLVTVNGTEYVTFNAKSFSPFVLVYEEESGGGGGGTHYSYTLRYDTNGGKAIQSESKSYSWTKPYEDLPTPVREGYTFDGWYLDSKLTDPVEDDVKVNRSTVTIYAAWSKDETDPDNNGVSDWLNTRDHNAYLNGYGDGTFGPDNNMTRAEAAQMFYNLLLDKEVPVTTSFTDVPADAWYAKAVNSLASLGLLEGVGNNLFAPDRLITRAEFTVIAMRFTEGDVTGTNIFSDVHTSDWFYDQVVGSIQYGWITGYADGTFQPNKTISRAEVTTIVNRMLGRSADQHFVDQNSDKLRAFPDVPLSHWAYYQIVEATNSHNYTKGSNGETWSLIL